MDNVLAIKLSLAAFCALALVATWASGVVWRVTARQFTWGSIVALAASRIGIFVLLFIVAHREPQSDVRAYYDLARQTLAGGVPYRDVLSPYGPAFSYVAAAAVWAWDTPKSIVLIAIAMEIAAWPLWLGAARRVFPEGVVRRAGVLYLTSAIALRSVAVGGQNHVWLAFFMAAATWFLVRRKAVLSGVALATSVVVVKFLTLVLAPVLFMAAKGARLRWLLGLAILMTLIHGALMAGHIDFLYQLRFNANHASSGNLPYLLGALGVDTLTGPARGVVNLLGLVAIGVLFLTAVSLRARDAQRDDDGWGAWAFHAQALVLLTVLLVSRKSFPEYIVVVLFPVCAALVTASARSRGSEGARATVYGWGAVAAVIGFDLAASVESSLWFRWMGAGELTILWSRTPWPAGLTTSRVTVFLFVEIAVLLVYAYLIRQSMRAVRTVLPPEGSSATEG